ncbi:pyridine nucleotide-disulfide oxidoreductase [Citrobacter sp. NCU1]|uniref:FAD-dependent oxidoreductase n=1 Tax=Citrobacter sp. NCU1 TaxID=2026683 RepID=UPI001391699E|nr:FAD-dependent oxidoreductase [Citrobacter sp. NCU1]NDO79648.1 pyridine nucleotide-disulfide oxidoreductase [Citrobacter sp. NCU1]
MNYYMEPAHQIPVLIETDVLVVGGGPSGIAAALASARAGVNTLIVERFGCLGGVLTTVGCEGYAWYRHEGTIEAGGIGIEIEQRAIEMGAARPEPQSDSYAIDAEMFKYVADKLMKESNVSVLLHCWAVDVIKNEDKVVGIITESKSGRTAIMAKRIIDCSADADIAYFAGAPINKRPREQMLGLTVMLNCTGVDVPKFESYIATQKPTYADWGTGFSDWSNKGEGITTSRKEDSMFSPYLESPFTQAKNDGLIPKDAKVCGTYSTFSEHGEATQLNLVTIRGLDCTDVWDLTKAEIDGRENCIHAIKALRAYVPGFEKSKLRNFGMTVGTRDSRKIIGLKTIDAEYVTNEGRCDDSIGIFPEFLDGYGLVVLPTTGRYFQIPYGILLPQQIDNLLVAGRAVSGDKVAHSSTRNMMCCAVTGQAAGVAAAVSIQTNTSTSNVNVQLIQDVLIKQGVRIS